MSQHQPGGPATAATGIEGQSVEYEGAGSEYGYSYGTYLDDLNSQLAAIRNKAELKQEREEELEYYAPLGEYNMGKVNTVLALRGLNEQVRERGIINKMGKLGGINMEGEKGGWKRKTDMKMPVASAASWAVGKITGKETEEWRADPKRKIEGWTDVKGMVEKGTGIVGGILSAVTGWQPGIEKMGPGDTFKGDGTGDATGIEPNEIVSQARKDGKGDATWDPAANAEKGFFGGLGSKISGGLGKLVDWNQDGKWFGTVDNKKVFGDNATDQAIIKQMKDQIPDNDGQATNKVDLNTDQNTVTNTDQNTVTNTDKDNPPFIKEDKKPWSDTMFTDEEMNADLPISNESNFIFAKDYKGPKNNLINKDNKTDDKKPKTFKADPKVYRTKSDKTVKVAKKVHPPTTDKSLRSTYGGKYKQKDEKKEALSQTKTMKKKVTKKAAVTTSAAKMETNAKKTQLSWGDASKAAKADGANLNELSNTVKTLKGPEKSNMQKLINSYFFN